MLAVRDNTIHEVLRESFVQSAEDSAWYPVEAQPGRSLVRVQVADSGYCVERRRSLDSPWAPIATVPIAEFVPAAFRTWRQNARSLFA
jgi:hypothetical protein